MWCLNVCVCVKHGPGALSVHARKACVCSGQLPERRVPVKLQLALHQKREQALVMFKLSTRKAVGGVARESSVERWWQHVNEDFEGAEPAWVFLRIAWY